MTAGTSKSQVESILFYTHNVARALKPSVDGELAHAIHETLHFALDGDQEDYYYRDEASTSQQTPCNGNDDQTQSNQASSSSRMSLDEDNVPVRAGFVATGDDERPYISYAWEEEHQTLVLPHPKTITNPTIIDPCTTAQEGTGVRDAFDVTAKFFFLGQGRQYSASAIQEALQRYTTATGLESVDTLIMSFGNNAHEQESRIDEMATLWKELSPDPSVLSMGISDFSETTLNRFLDRLELRPSSSSDPDRLPQHTPSPPVPSTPSDSLVTKQVKETVSNNIESGAITDAKTAATTTHVHIPSSPSKAVFTELAGEDEEALREYGPGSCRKPRLCTINLTEKPANGTNASDSNAKATNTSAANGSKNGSCCWDRGLATVCKENQILLVAHSDRRDLLPARTLPTLMKEFEGRLPHPLPDNSRLEPLWCFKYTVLIRDRGVLADKGFILHAKVVTT